MMSLPVSHALAVTALAMLFVNGAGRGTVGNSSAAPSNETAGIVKVAGSGFDDLKNAIVHSEKPTATGKIQQSTQAVELYGDLRGRVLYHVTSVFDFVRGTLVNTGDQVYSGTIIGSAPVMIHDDQFRFEVNLVTGKEVGHMRSGVAIPPAATAR
jgi:predicted membrane GTPase involved in stress response